MTSASRRQFLAGLGGLALVPCLPACGQARGRPFTVAAHVWPGYETLFLARRQGWLDEKQVRLVETPSATTTLQALSSGIVDGAALTLDEVLRARALGLSVGIVLVFDVSAGADMVLARPGIKSLTDLKGRTVGVEQGGLGAVMLADALQSVGLAPSDVQQRSLPPVEQLDAWRQGGLDAVVTYEPVASRLLAEGARRLYDSRNMPRVIMDVLAVRSEVLAIRAAAARHLVAGHFRALDYLSNRFSDAAELMAPRLHLQTDEVRKAFGGLELPDLAQNRHMLAGQHPELLDSARQLSRSMLKIGLLPREDTLVGLLYADFLPS